MEDKIRFAISKINKNEISQFEIYNKMYELDLIDDTINISIIKKRFLESLLKLVTLKEFSMNIKNGILYIINNEVKNKTNLYDTNCFLIDNNCEVMNKVLTLKVLIENNDTKRFEKVINKITDIDTIKELKTDNTEINSIIIKRIYSEFKIISKNLNSIQNSLQKEKLKLNLIYSILFTYLYKFYLIILFGISLTIYFYKRKMI